MRFRNHIAPLAASLVFLSLAISAKAQESVVWVKNFPATSTVSQGPVGLTTDMDGNVYFVYIKGGFGANQNADWHLAKVSPSGNVVFDNVIAETDSSTLYLESIIQNNPIIQFSKGGDKAGPRVTVILTKGAPDGSSSTLLVEAFDLLGNPVYAAPVVVPGTSANQEDLEGVDVADNGTVYLAFDDLTKLCFDTVSNQGVAQPLVTTTLFPFPHNVQHLKDGDWLLGYETWSVVNGKTGLVRFSGPAATGPDSRELAYALPNDEILGIEDAQTLTPPRMLIHVATIYTKEGKKKKSTDALPGWKDNNFVDPKGHHIYLGGTHLDADGKIRSYVESFDHDLKLKWTKQIPIQIPVQIEFADDKGFFVSIGSYINSTFYGAPSTVALLQHYKLDGTLDSTLAYSPSATGALVFQLVQSRGDIYTTLWAEGLTGLGPDSSEFLLVRLRVK